jgi:hypothetical protein
MIEEILKEKTSADHLMYVSLKYTKTCDVILNLIARWKSMIEMSYDALLQKAVDDKKIPSLPLTPKDRILFIKKYFAKSTAVQDSVPVYIFFKRIPELNKTRSGEFRKNVCLKITDVNSSIEVNMDKLKEYSDLLERFISEVKHLLSK